MRNIIVKIYSCNKLTYKNIYFDAVKRVYAKEKIDILPSEVKVQIIDLSNNGTKEIQQQRTASGEHCRIMQVYEANKCKCLIGVTNTNYDEDIRTERIITGRKNKYGSNDYHANTYLIQGINKIFKRYFDMKSQFKNIKLYFYLLDTERSYPSNAFNLWSYRMLATLGFDVLNIDEIDFSEFKNFGFKPNSTFTNLEYPSFNKFMNDKLAISNNNKGNIPAYLKCVEEVLKDGTIVTEKYIYTFKVLGAQAYECFITMWTLYLLAKREKKNLEFLFSLEHYGFRIPNREIKITKDLPKPVKELLKIVGIDIHYETSDEILQEINNKATQFERAKAANDLRNQSLFRNNIREKGVPTKCAICGCEIEDLLDAAHLWGVAQIRQENRNTINKLLSTTSLKDLIDNDDPYRNDIFYQKYTLANSGDNGIWLCKNHHGLFDKNYFCFDSMHGKILFKTDKEKMKIILGIDDLDEAILNDDILNKRTAVFLEKRMEDFFKLPIEEIVESYVEDSSKDLKDLSQKKDK